MRKVIFALVGLASVLSCSSNPISTVDSNGTLHLPAVGSYTMYLDGSVSPDMALAVNEAVRQWQEYTDVKIHIRGGDEVCVEGCFTVFEVSRKTLDTVTLDSHYIRYTTLGVIGVAEGMQWDELQDTMIHEFGHALGLVHHPLPAYAVMNPSYLGGADHVACDDVKQYYAVRNEVVPSNFSPCSDTPGPQDETSSAFPQPIVDQDAAYPVNFDAAVTELEQ